MIADGGRSVRGGKEGDMHQFEGGCHCGNIRVVYRTGIAPEAARPRACQCSFCRKQNTRMVSDPAGHLAISVADGGRLNRYRFALGLSDYLTCRTCGVYVAAFMADPDEAHGLATLMVNALVSEARFPQAAPISYDGEDAASRRDRRRQRWTPASLTVAAPLRS